MANTATQKQKSTGQQPNDMDHKQEKRRDDIQAGERAQREDLKDMQTGTHDAGKHGVHSGSSYETPQNDPPKRKTEKKKTDQSSREASKEEKPVNTEG